MKRDDIGFAPSVLIGSRHLLFTFFITLSIAMGALLILPTPYNFIPFVIIGGIGFLVISIRYSMIGIFIYMILFFIRPQELFPSVAIFSYPYEKIVGIMVIANLALDIAINNKKIKVLEMDKAIVFVMAAAFISIATSIWISWSWFNFEKFFKILLVYFFMSRLIDSQEKFKWIVWLYIITTAFIAVSSTINYYQGHYQTTMGIQRAVGMGEQGSAYGDPNSMAATLVLGMPFMFYIAKAYRNRLIKAFMLGLLAICLWTVIITGSRGGMLAAAFTMMLIAWKSRQKVVATVVALLVMILALAVMPEQYSKRLTSIANYEDQYDETGAAESARGRIKGLKVGFEILIHRPLAGAGIGCFGIYNSQNHGSSLNAHNLLGQLMGELGMAGLLAFGVLLYLIFKHARYIRERYEEKNWPLDLNYYVAISVNVATYSLLFLGLFGHNAYRFNWYIFACFLAIAANLVMQRLKRETEPAAPAIEPAPQPEG